MDKHFINKVNNRLLFEPQHPEQSDVAILLGAEGVSGDIARKAAKDCLSGKFNKIVLSGGMRIFQPHVYAFIKTSCRKYPELSLQISDFSSLKKEADYMREILIKEHVPQSAIVFEDNQSTNTGQNFKNIKDAVSYFKTAVIYTTAYHQRRAVETCAQVVPHLQTTPVPVYPYGLSRQTWLDQWAKTIGIRNIVADEYQKLNRNNPNSFYNQGFCVPVNIEILKLTNNS